MRVDWLGLVKFLGVMLIIAFVVYPGDSKLGVGYRMSHQLETAEEKLLQAYAKDSTDRIVIENLIDTYDELGRLGKRMRFLERLIVLYPSHLPFLRRVQEQFNWEQDLDGLVRTSELILKYYPLDSLSLEYCLGSYQTLGRLDKSRKLLERIDRVSPLSEQRMEYYVFVLEQLGDIEAYEQIVRKRFEKNSGNQKLFEELASLLVLQEKTVALEFLMTGRLQRFKNIKTAKYLAKLYESLGKPLNSAQILLDYLEINPSKEELRRDVAKFYSSGNRHDLAVAQLDVLAQKEPSNELFLEMAKLSQWDNNTSGEIEQYKRLLDNGYKVDQMYLKIIERYGWKLDYANQNKYEMLRLKSLGAVQQNDYAKTIFKGYVEKKEFIKAYDIAWQFMEKGLELKYWSDKIYSLSLWSGNPKVKMAGGEGTNEKMTSSILEYHMKVCEKLKPWLKPSDELYNSIFYSQLGYYQGISNYPKSRELIFQMMSKPNPVAKDTFWVDENFKNSLFSSNFLWAKEDLDLRRQLGRPRVEAELELATNLLFAGYPKESIELFGSYYRDSSIQMNDLNNMIDAATRLNKESMVLELKLYRYQLIAQNSENDPESYISAMIEKDDFYTLREFSGRVMNKKRLSQVSYSKLFNYWLEREDYQGLISFLRVYKKFNVVVPKEFKVKTVALSNSLAFEELELANHLLAGVDL